MIDRERLDLVRQRLRALRERGDGDPALADDIDWLIERAEQLADDNDRLARLVAEITDIVAGTDAKGGVADVIDLALARTRQAPKS